MKIRNVARVVGVSAAAACLSGLAALSFAGTAGAAPLTSPSGSQVAVASPSGPVTAGTPFQSGQLITVSVPANTLFSSGGVNTGTNLEIAECAAPNGVLPTVSAACDTNTLDSSTINPNSDGSVSFSPYPLYALPDAPSLFEPPTQTPVCGDTAATECVLYLGANVEDFTQPHFFTQGFQVVADAGDLAPNPGDGTPEVPLAVGLPLAALAIMGGFLYRRRRTSRSAA